MLALALAVLMVLTLVACVARLIDKDKLMIMDEPKVYDIVNKNYANIGGYLVWDF